MKLLTSACVASFLLGLVFVIRWPVLIATYCSLFLRSCDGMARLSRPRAIVFKFPSHMIYAVTQVLQWDSRPLPSAAIHLDRHATTTPRQNGSICEAPHTHSSCNDELNCCLYKKFKRRSRRLLASPEMFGHFRHLTLLGWNFAYISVIRDISKQIWRQTFRSSPHLEIVFNDFAAVGLDNRHHPQVTFHHPPEPKIWNPHKRRVAILAKVWGYRVSLLVEIVPISTTHSYANSMAL